MTKILSWNVGSFFFLKYAAQLKLKHKGITIPHQYFNGKLNGDFVSENIVDINPDIIILQEVTEEKDLEYLPALIDYPFQKFVGTIYHDHFMLVASKTPLSMSKFGLYTIFDNGEFKFIPIHFAPLSSKTKQHEVRLIKEFTDNASRTLIIGDSNLWSIRGLFLLRGDKKAYKMLTDEMVDFGKWINRAVITGFEFDKVIGTPDITISDLQCLRRKQAFMDHFPIVVEVE